MEQQDEPLDSQEVIFCSKCGNQESVGSHFCSKCGAPLARTIISSSAAREGMRTLFQRINENIDKVAIASAVLVTIGVLTFWCWWFLGFLAGLGAIGAGIYAKRQIKKGNKGRLKLARLGIWGGIAVAGLALIASPRPGDSKIPERGRNETTASSSSSAAEMRAVAAFVQMLSGAGRQQGSSYNQEREWQAEQQQMRQIEQDALRRAQLQEYYPNAVPYQKW